MMNILVTGATSGIGQAIAYHLSQRGHQVIGCGRRVEDELNSNAISWLKMDVTKQQSVDDVVGKAVSHFGRLDVLIQCADRGAIGPVESFHVEDIDEVLQLNVYGIQRVNRSILPIMRQQGTGRIMVISSLAAEAGLPYSGVYSASKAMLDTLMESLCMEVKQFGIQACVVQPGDFKTDVSSGRKIPEEVENSPYKTQFEHVNATVTANVAHAGDPIKVAYKIEKILNKKHLKPKYRVGAPIELLMPIIKSVLPQRCFQALLMKFYRL